jgi:hypothetical protein
VGPALRKAARLLRCAKEALVALRALTRPIVAAAAALLCAAASPAGPSFVPVLKDNFPDAFVLQDGGRFIAYSTNDGPNVPMATSNDLVHWNFVANADGKKRDALPKLGSWAKVGFTWAPEVLKLGGKYLLYYTPQATPAGTRNASASRSRPIRSARSSTAIPSRSSARPGSAEASTPTRSATRTASSISTSRTTGTGSVRAPPCGVRHWLRTG